MKKSPPKKTKKGTKETARAVTRRKPDPRPAVSRPPRTSPDEREAAALRLFDEIEASGGSEARAMAERAAAQVMESFVRKMGHELANYIDGLYAANDHLNKIVEGPEIDRAALAENAERRRASLLRVHRLFERTRDAVMLSRHHMNEEAVAPLIEEVRAAVVSELGPAAARFDFTADVEDGLTIHADHPHLLRALTDVVKNAAEAYPVASPRAPVHLTARARGRTIEIVVADEGVGLSAESLAYAFVAFSTSKRTTGLGLYIARGDIEDRHGGRLTVESEGRGRGTRVRIVLPRRQANLQPRRRLTHDEMFAEAARRERAAAGLP